MSDQYDLDIRRGVAHIMLNRPERLNALTFESYVALATTFDDLSDNAEVRAITLTGAGRGFCSGGDVDGIIGQLFGRDIKGLLAFTRHTGNLIRAICEVKQPVVAAINGACVGAGAVMACACDLWIAARKAKFGFIFPKVGLSGADMGSAFLLPQLIGESRAKELLLFGDIFTAEQAYDYGFVNRVTEDAESCRELAYEWADRLARGPAFAHTVTKTMVAKERHMSLRDALEAEAQAQAICMAHPDFKTAYEANTAKARIEPLFEGAEITRE